jgi:replicative DNA helicase
MTDTLRTPPFDDEAERAVIGSVLLDNGVLPRLAAMIGPEVFYADRHRRIWSAILGMQGAAIDHVTLAERLRGAGDFDRIGGATALASLTDAVATTAHASRYAEIVREKAAARQLIAAAQEIVARGYAGYEGDFAAWTSDARSALGSALSPALSRGAPMLLDDALRAGYNHAVSQGDPPGLIKTGISTLDATTGGLWPGLVTVLAARPSMGKSAVALAIATNAALMGKKVLYVTLEDTDEFIALRQLARFSGVDLMDLVLRTINVNSYNALTQGLAKASNAGLWISDAAGLSSADIRALAHAHAIEHGLDFLIIDHALEIREPKLAHDPTASVGYSAMTIRDTAKELRVPALLLCQLNRGVEARQDKRPLMSDLRQSGRLEEVARQVWLLYRESYYTGNKDDHLIDLIIGKSSHGRTGNVKLWCDLAKMQIRGWDDHADATPSRASVAPAPPTRSGGEPGFRTWAASEAQDY